MAKLVPTIVYASLFLCSTAYAANEITRNQNGSFSARISNANLAELTRSITESHGIEFKGQDDLLQSTVSVSFDNVKLEEMVKKILGGKNYVFKYDSQGNLTEVTLLPKSQNDTRARPTTPAVIARPPVAAVPPTPSPQAQEANPGAGPVAGSPPVKEDPDNKEGQAGPGDPSTSPEIPVPVPEQ